MSIEQKIAEILAESKGQVAEELEDEVIYEEELDEEELDEEDLKELSKKTLGNYINKATRSATNSARKFGVSQERDGGEDEFGSGDDSHNEKMYKRETGIKTAVKKLTKEELDVADDVAALVNGEDLSEEFKAKAATIFEAAIVNRVRQEVATLEEEFEAKLEEAAAENQEGLVEKVDGYLNYVVETWIAQNEIALERGMKSDILENFVSGLKDLFVESWIDVPEEKYDVLADMETQVSELQDKLDEQLAANVEMNKIIAEQTRVDIIKDACNGLTDTEVEKFTGLAEELAYEDADTFATKVQTIRENYFTNKAGKSLVESVVTDTPVESLTEEKVVDPSMKRYMNALNNVK